MLKNCKISKRSDGGVTAIRRLMVSQLTLAALPLAAICNTYRGMNTFIKKKKLLVRTVKNVHSLYSALCQNAFSVVAFVFFAFISWFLCFWLACFVVPSNSVR